MKPKTTALLAGMTLAISAAFPVASDAAVLYASTKAGGLFTLNTTTAAPTSVGTMPFPATEIEYDNNSNRAWAQQPDGSFTIHEFNIATAAGIGPTTFDGASFTGLEYVGASLYGASIGSGGGSAPSTLRILNPNTGTSVAVGPTGVGAIAGLAYDVGSGTMYGIRGGPGPADLLSINLTTGLAMIIGTTGIQAGSLEFGPDGLLYAGGTGLAVEGFLFRINTATGASTLVGDTGLVDLTGLTLVGAIPEPASGITLLGLAGLALARRWGTERGHS